MNKAENEQIYTIRIKKKLRAALQECANRRNLTLSTYIRLILVNHVVEDMDLK